MRLFNSRMHWALIGVLSMALTACGDGESASPFEPLPSGTPTAPPGPSGSPSPSPSASPSPSPSSSPSPSPSATPLPSPLDAPTLSFVAPGRSLDLANYTLTAQHDLPVGSGANLLGSEASAVTYRRDTGTLFITGDHGTSVIQVSRSGEFIDSMTLGADVSQPQGTFIYDPEGIASIGDGQFVLVEERDREIVRFTYSPDTTLTAADVQIVKLGTSIGNVGLEGVSFDPLTGGFILVKEKDPQGLFLTQVDFDQGTATNGAPTQVNSTNLYDPAQLGVVDLGDIYALSNVLDPSADDYAHLLVLSHESGLLLHTDRQGNVFGVIDVGLPAQHEGITADESGVLYVANELGGGNDQPQIWVFTPTTGPDAVGVGSRLYLQFDENIEVAGGALSLSGAGDTRSISVSANEQIGVDGNVLIVDPATDLMPGVAYTLRLPAGALRGVASGADSPMIDLAFTTRNEAVPPTLVRTLPADNAVAVPTSRITLTFSEPVVAGAGDIIISDGGADTRTVSVADSSQVTFTGDTLEIMLAADLNPATVYNVQLDRGVVVDLAGNAFAGIIGPESFNFTTAAAGGGAPPTQLFAGDILFMGANADSTDAFTFVLLQDVTAGTQVGFTDKDYAADAPTFPTNEAAFTWTADVAYPAGTIVTIQPGTLLTDFGSSVGASGGIGGNGETYYAFQGSIIDADLGQIFVDRFIAAINLGPDAGEIPDELVAADAFIRFDEDNARYAGSLDRTDLSTFADLVRNPANWEVDDNLSFPLINGSLFGDRLPPPEGMTDLNPGDLLFVGINADAEDVIAFALLKDVIAGTEIGFTDKDYVTGATTFPTNEAAFTWSADISYPAGTVVTIQTRELIASRGAVQGESGGISGSAETYYAFQGQIVSPSNGQINVDRFLATITVGAPAGDVPPEVTAAGAAFTFAENNARYNASLDRSDLPAFADRVKDLGNWAVDDVTAFPLFDGSLFGGTRLHIGDVLFMAANADTPDAIAFVLLQDVVAGTQIGFTDKDVVIGGSFPTNEAGFTWTADTAYPAGTLVTVNVDALLVDRGTVYGASGGISPNAETYYAFQGDIINAELGQIFADRFLAAITLGSDAGEIPPELVAGQTYFSFIEDNVIYAGPLDRSDLGLFAARVRDLGNWSRSDDAAFPIDGGTLFP